jgi:glucosyl-3-phosphoglycerate synthase
MSKKKKAPKSTHRETASDQAQNYTIVVPIFEEVQSEWLVQTALSLAQTRRRGQVLLVGMVLIPKSESLSSGAQQAQRARANLEKIRKTYKGNPVKIKPRVRVDYEPRRALSRIVTKERASLVLLPWGEPGDDQACEPSRDWQFDDFGCNVVVAYGATPGNIKKILMPLLDRHEIPLTLQVGLELAKAKKAQLTMLYAPDEDSKPGRQQVYEELARINRNSPRITELRVDGNATATALVYAQNHDLVVIGASDQEGGSVSPMVRRLKEQQKTPLLVVRPHEPHPPEHIARLIRSQPLPTTQTSVLVDKWFAENTFSSKEFKDLEYLVSLKRAEGVTISLGLPALNEEETVGHIIKLVKSKLMDKLPLLDEIILIDSGSTDATVNIAIDSGIPVYQHSEILPQYGSYCGKGEALWKSLYVLKGDIVAWIDTDIVNIHPRFVYGVLGPLLARPAIQYSKGFYRRPIKVGASLRASGGGRVTELVARPLFNLFYPELSGLVQPLSGEYAGRRSAFQQVPFYTGYGVETGLLLNLVQRYGIGSIAQVDLRRRVHHNQSLGALSRMSFAIIQVFIDHLEHRKKVELLSDVNRTMKNIGYSKGAYFLEEHPISDARRPPIIQLAEYREKQGITDPRWREQQINDVDQKVASS